jgi:subtilisin family serine protease
MSLRLAVLCGTATTACVLASSAAALPTAAVHGPWPRGVAVVSYESPRDLTTALRHAHGRVVRRVPALRVAEVAPRGGFTPFVEALARQRGIRSVERLATKTRAGEPALTLLQASGLALEWQYAATRCDGVPAQVLRAAGQITIGVVDTGADVTAPDLAAKNVQGFNLAARNADIRDFVSSLAAGSVSNGEGIAGFGGDANLLVVKVAGKGGTISDVDEAAAIVYAVDHGARIVNLSFGGPTTSATERAAIDYAAGQGVLLVAAVGNEFRSGNPVEYPAALLQPVGSNGRGGRGLAVGASTLDGTRASFSNTGTHVSLAAPGEDVLGAVSSLAPPARFDRVSLPGSRAGIYGVGSGTSFAAPQVAGAAALVWAANPSLAPGDVAQILKQTASGRGGWTPELGFGVIDVASAVSRAAGTAQALQLVASRTGLRIRLRWQGSPASAYRVSVSTDGWPARKLFEGPGETTTFGARRGHTYVFAATGLDEAGATVAASAAVRIRVPR